MSTEYYRYYRSYLLFQCRGYWDSTTCANKIGHQRNLAGLRSIYYQNK